MGAGTDGVGVADSGAGGFCTDGAGGVGSGIRGTIGMTNHHHGMLALFVTFTTVALLLSALTVMVAVPSPLSFTAPAVSLPKRGVAQEVKVSDAGIVSLSVTIVPTGICGSLWVSPSLSVNVSFLDSLPMPHVAVNWYSFDLLLEEPATRPTTSLVISTVPSLS